INVLDVYNSQSNYVTWADATPSNGALSVVLFKSQALGNILNCMRISGYNGPMPATPSSGSWTGGYPVVIAGENINDGSDITNVTLCGVQATIVSQIIGRVWVTAGSSTNIGTGDIVVQSVSYGATIGSNVFAYTGAGILVSSPPFTSVPFGSIVTNILNVTNSGNEALLITAATNSGAGAAHFDMSALTGLTVDPGTASNVPVVFTASAVGTFTPTCYLANNSPVPSYTFGLTGSVFAASTNIGPYAGGNTITITNGYFGTITNVLIIQTGMSVLPSASGANWFTITLPAATNAGTVDIVVQTSDNGDITLANAYTYNPAGELGGLMPDWSHWTTIEDLPRSIYGMGSATLEGKVYSIGGYTGSYRTNVYGFDGSFWSEVAGLPLAVSRPGAATMGGLIYVVAGSGNSSYTTNVYTFDGSSWGEVAGLPVALDDVACAEFQGQLYAIGGHAATTYTNVYCFDGSSWSEVAGLPAAGQGFAVAVLDDRLYAFGGGMTNAFRFDGANWSSAPGLPFAYSGNKAATMDGVMYSAGGMLGGSGRTNVYSFDGTNWVSIPGLTYATRNFGFAVMDNKLHAYGGYDSSYQNDACRYPTNVEVAAATPSSGSWTGGYAVMLRGSNLGNGTDITNVTLAGVAVTNITSQSSTQVVVWAGQAGASGVGDVVVQSTSFGETVKSNAFTYLASEISISASAFAPTPLNAIVTNIFTVTNAGNESLTISAATNNGTGASDFDISALAGLIVDVGTASNVPVLFTASAVGTFTPTCYLVNNSPTPSYTFGLTGSVFASSTNVGPYAGGNTITITNGNFGTITNILLGPPSVGSAAIIASGPNWFTITLPAATNATGGAVSLTVQTSDNGDTTLVNAYTYNPAGAIGYADWSGWEEVAGLPEARYSTATAVLGDYLYSIGGYDSSDTVATNVYRYDGSSWTEAEGYPLELGYFPAATFGNYIYTVGGEDMSNSMQTNVFRFNGTWEEVAGLPSAASFNSAAVFQGHLYSVAGDFSTNVYRFNGTNWQSQAGLSQVLSSAGIGVLGARLYFVGGMNSGWFAVSNVYCFDGTNWMETVSLPEPRTLFGVASLESKLYAVGGDYDQWESYNATTNVWSFDGTNWTACPGLPKSVSWMSACTYRGALYCIAGWDGSNTGTNVYRYPASKMGVEPSSGSWTGGYQVVITGTNLCDGSDITNVTLCGISADSIVSQSATQIVAVAGASISGSLGDVVVQSTSFGTTTKSNAFTYNASGIDVAAPAFAPTPLGTIVTNIFTVTNSGDEALLITAATNSGAGAAYFNVTGLTGLTVAPGTASNVPVVFTASAVGTFTPTCYLVNNSPTPSYTFGLTGHVFQLSTNIGPYAGGNTITITNGNFGTITNVLITQTGMSVLPSASGPNWFTITLPAATNAGTVDLIVQTDSGDILLADAYTYNPSGEIGASDWSRWEELEPLNMPLAFSAHGVVNNTLYCFGGFNPDFSLRTNAYSFDGEIWTAIAGLPLGLSGNTGVTAMDGNLYALGGWNSSIARTNVWFFDGSTWTATNGLPLPMKNHAVAVLDGDMYAFGGTLSTNGLEANTNILKYSGSSWSFVGTEETQIDNSTAVVYSNLIYLISGSDVGTFTNCYSYDGIATNLMPVNGTPLQYDLSVAALMNGKIYAAGGSAGFALTNCYTFDGTTWEAFPGLPSPRMYMSGGLIDGALYVAGGMETNTAKTNVYRYPARGPGVAPSSGSWTGGYQVTISGENLGNGTDITNVSLCGVTVASIDSQSATQVVVTAGATSGGAAGRVVIQSVSFGATIESNAFTYVAPTMGVLGTNGAAIASDDAIDLAKGSKFYATQVSMALTNTFAITNTGNDVLSISGWTTNGANADLFTLSGVPSSVAVGGVDTFTVVYNPTAIGTHVATVNFASDDPVSPFVFNLGGSCFAGSTNVGPYTGGNTLTITNGYFGTITNVLLGPPSVGSAAIIASGSNWFTITLPAASAAGAVDITVQTSDSGEIVLPDAYTYNQAGAIGFREYDWTMWEEVVGLPGPRSGAGAAVYNGDLLVYGGKYGSGISDVSGRAYRFDETNWVRIADLVNPRAYTVGGVLSLSNVLWAGGGYNAGWSVNNQQYEGTNWTVDSLGPYIYAFGAGSVVGDSIFTVGGSYLGDYTNLVYRFNGASVTNVADLPLPLAYHAVATLGDNLYSVGGYNSVDLHRTNVFRFNGSEWAEVAGLPTSNASMSAATLGSYLYAIGGYDGANYKTNVYRYDATSWTEIVGLPQPMRYQASATFNGQIYAIGGYNGSYMTNVYRYPELTNENIGISPISGSWTGGYPVVITGSNLCNGGDATNVTLCGIPVISIDSQSSTQLTVTAGAASGLMAGHVRVYSVSFGQTLKNNAFTYTSGEQTLLGTNGAVIASGDAASLAKGSAFHPTPFGSALTNTFSITNSGNDVLSINPSDLSDPSDFSIAGIPATVDIGTVSNFTVTYSPTTIGDHSAFVVFTNNAPDSPFTLNLAGSCYTASTNIGPYAGGNSITITNGTLGDGADITNVLVGGIAATVTAQGTDWVTITLPAAASPGSVNILIQSTSAGDTFMANAYTYNPAGKVVNYGVDWNQWSETAGLPQGRSRL
ncbi:MAG: choice-of-anchor D domain-containing protein, partial [Spartobacteria bacterium]|nr:choice-of-anchor D domain-containing protein [Spartobacteria bacterium]